ncbi:MAG TPA: hypothetical protein VF524_01570, partial [Polyangia bacterium]
MTGRGLHELLAVMALSLSTVGCSSVVNALYGADAAADVAAGSVDVQAGVGDVDGVTAAIQVCPSLSGAPAGVGPLPSPFQIAYQRTELTAFMHFGLNTFDGTEYGDSAKDAPSL